MVASCDEYCYVITVLVGRVLYHFSAHWPSVRLVHNWMLTSCPLNRIAGRLLIRPSSACGCGQLSIDGSPSALWLYSSEQHSVHRFSICRSSVRHFPERSWTVVAFPCFTAVKSFTSWYTLLLKIFLFSHSKLKTEILFNKCFYFHE